ncbi:MAG: acyltransferase [Gammaproteobacteria bacterium]|nr:acyltransferase [Gammaproteobacteria bacterium]MCW8924530.1 acyltransferase [Gammaproteobacteria bacterium]
MKYIHTLTGLRGLAALMVFVSHAANETLLPNIWSKGFGQTGVMIFFVLSGFLMTHLYVHEDFNRTNVIKYSLARIGRVFPLYLILLAISLIITKYIYSDFYYKLDNISQSINAFLFIEAPYAFWTIPVEVQFYLIFIGFWFVHKRSPSPITLVLFVTVTMLPSVILYIGFSKLPRFVSLYSYAFFIGVATALYQERIRNNKLIKKYASATGYPLVILLLFIYTPFNREQFELTYFESTYLRTWGDPITWLIVYGVFICAILNTRSMAFLNYKPFVYLGGISYGFYLMHYPILMYFKDMKINSALQLIFAFTVTTILSHISYHYFEKRLGKKIKNTIYCNKILT